MLMSQVHSFLNIIPNIKTITVFHTVTKSKNMSHYFKVHRVSLLNPLHNWWPGSPQTCSSWREFPSWLFSHPGSSDSIQCWCMWLNVIEVQETKIIGQTIKLCVSNLVRNAIINLLNTGHKGTQTSKTNIYIFNAFFVLYIEPG